MRVERAVVLAAGMGTRLKWLTWNRPKALMPLRGGDAVIERVIRRLAAAGIHDVAVNVHHHGQQLMRALGDGRRLGVRLYYSVEDALLDSGGGVRSALQRLPGDGPLAVHNADILTDLDVTGLARRCPEGGACLGLVDNPPHHPRGDFSLRGGQVMTDGAPRLTFAGVSVWDPVALRRWPAGARFPLTAAIRALMAEGRCAGVRHEGWWFDIGRPADWLRARRFDALQA